MSTRLLLRLYPRAWRERYGEELIELAGSHVTWRVAMDIATSGLKERFSGEGYSPAGFVRLAVRLAVAFAIFGSAVGLLFGWQSVSPYASMWGMFSLFSLLLALLANGFGWRESRPRSASALVRFGVCSWMFFWTFTKEIQAHFHVSPYSQLGVGLMFVAALIVGFVVDSARLGERRQVIAKQ